MPVILATAIANPNTITSLQSIKLKKLFPIGSCFRGQKFVVRGSKAQAPKIMIESASSSGNGVQSVSSSVNGVQSFEQEALVEGFSDSRASGIEAALNSSSKWLVALLFGAVVLWRHDAAALWALMGAVLNAMLSVALKKILKQERPISTLRSDPGMPSSHAMSIFYMVAFFNLSMTEWYGTNGLTITLNGLLFILGCYFSWLRVAQRLHTLSQVVVGAVCGYAFSILWLYSWKAFVLKAFVSYVSVRIVVVLGAIGFVVGFLRHVYLTWLLTEK